MEGPFDAALMARDAGALRTWQAIGRYNHFLKDHEDLYWRADGISPVAVLLSEARRGNVIQFGWDKDDSGLYDLLAKNSVLHDIRLIGALEEKQLRAYAGVVVPAFVTPDAAQTAMLQRYRESGGRIYAVDNAVLQNLRSSAPPEPKCWRRYAPWVRTGWLSPWKAQRTCSGP